MNMIITNNLNKKKIIILASISSVVAGIIFAVWVIRNIFQHPDAQGGIALFLMPIFVAVAIIIFWLIIFSILYLFKFLSVKIKHQPTSRTDKVLAVVSVVIIILPIVIIYFYNKQYLLEEQAGSDTTVKQGEFYQLYKNAIDSDNIGVLSRIAKNPNTPVELLSQLFNYANEKTLQKNKYTYSKYYLILDNLACNQNATTDLLTQLSKIDVDMVRYCVAGNPNTAIDILRQLAATEKDNSQMVLSAIAGNPKTTLDILQELVKHQDSSVSTAANINLQRHSK